MFGMPDDLKAMVKNFKLLKATPFKYGDFDMSTNGSAPGACTNPIDRSFIQIPDSFVAPPKPADYRRPAALGPLGPTPGRATQPLAGRPGPRAASVAAAYEVEGGDDHPSNLFPDNLGLDEGQVSALAEIQEEELLKEWDNGPQAPEFKASSVALYAQLAGMSLSFEDESDDGAVTQAGPIPMDTADPGDSANPIRFSATANTDSQGASNI
ncbi:hypothetical protein PTTG_30499 [Puccinia triticina 1-1 BBBD Race 1]|uniref:Uncharacterized protein n=1 Tax=Puccinia triticina (isolate 1-1 / race 1 (BBBD)) TaxID=630390 RepID=A0A180FYJ4_PUCT1|nr:hypothetical protein PTTG_30499 [Puccinia triticina 1-1 BBBD Race 1]